MYRLEFSKIAIEFHKNCPEAKTPLSLHFHALPSSFLKYWDYAFSHSALWAVAFAIGLSLSLRFIIFPLISPDYGLRCEKFELWYLDYIKQTDAGGSIVDPMSSIVLMEIFNSGAYLGLIHAFLWKIFKWPALQAITKTGLKFYVDCYPSHAEISYLGGLIKFIIEH